MAESKDTLLLLGGAHYQCGAIETAKRIGYRTVLCDYLSDNPGQYIADTYYPVSTTDFDAIYEVAQREKIKGILSFGSDVALPCATRVAEKLGLPANPLQSVEILSKKELFHPYLAKHGFNAPHSMSYKLPKDLPDLVKDLPTLGETVVIKPSDASGSKGVSMLQAPHEKTLLKAVEYALAYSRNNTVIVEESIQYGYPNLIGGDIFVVDGKVEFWGLMSCIRSNNGSSLIPRGKAYPSGLEVEQEQALRDEISRLVEKLNIRFAEMNLEAIIDPLGRPFILELAGRAGGNYIPLQLQDLSGVDLIEANVLFAMGNKIDNLEFVNGSKIIATYVLATNSNGVFDRIEYSKTLKSHMYREILHTLPGDKIERLTDSSKSLGVIFLEFESYEEMWALINKIDKHVQVYFR